MKRLLCRLHDRSILRLRPSDASKASPNEVGSFLQGLITNDVRHLQPSSEQPQKNLRSMYSLFLNAKGRVLYDSLVYSAAERPDTFLVECDESVSTRLQKHLKLFKVRRNIDIEIADQAVWALLGESPSNGPPTEIPTEDNTTMYDDPRVHSMGSRILTAKSTREEDLLKRIPDAKLVDADGYRAFRYALGVPEGTAEIPVETSFPLEYNCDYLHGVSFHKGCYIGQELTARTHHTGVVRKRIMPLLFEDEIDEPIPNDTPIYATGDDKRSIGKVRGSAKNVGIGLLRIDEALAAPSLTILGRKASTLRPSWWPIEATKNKAGN